MRKAFTLIELMIVISVIAVIAAIAIPNLVASKRLREEQVALNAIGKMVTLKGHDIQVMVVKKEGDFFVCRVDNGTGSSPRFSEVRFHKTEIMLPNGGKVERDY